MRAGQARGRAGRAERSPVGASRAHDRVAPGGRGGRAAARERPGNRAGPHLLPAGRRGGDLASVGRPRVAHGRGEPERRRLLRVVHAVRRHGADAWQAARAGHGGDERAAGHQRHVEHLAAPARGAAHAGDAAVRAADLAHRADDRRVCGLGRGPVLASPVLANKSSFFPLCRRMRY